MIRAFGVNIDLKNKKSFWKWHRNLHNIPIKTTNSVKYNHKFYRFWEILLLIPLPFPGVNALNNSNEKFEWGQPIFNKLISSQFSSVRFCFIGEKKWNLFPFTDWLDVIQMFQRNNTHHKRLVAHFKLKNNNRYTYRNPIDSYRTNPETFCLFSFKNSVKHICNCRNWDLCERIFSPKYFCR